MKKLFLLLVLSILPLQVFWYTQQEVSSALNSVMSRFSAEQQLEKLNATIPKLGKMQLANPPAEVWDILKKLETAIRAKIKDLLWNLYEIETRPLNQLENDLFVIMNQYRAQKWLSPLVINEKLNQAALILAKDMKKLNYFTHVSPEWVGYVQRLELVGYPFDYVSENLWQWETDADLIVKLWSESQVHKVNLFHVDADEVWVAYTTDHYWVAVYASPLD